MCKFLIDKINSGLFSYSVDKILQYFSIDQEGGQLRLCSILSPTPYATKAFPQSQPFFFKKQSPLICFPASFIIQGKNLTGVLVLANGNLDFYSPIAEITIPLKIPTGQSPVLITNCIFMDGGDSENQLISLSSNGELFFSQLDPSNYVEQIVASRIALPLQSIISTRLCRLDSKTCLLLAQNESNITILYLSFQHSPLLLLSETASPDSTFAISRYDCSDGVEFYILEASRLRNGLQKRIYGILDGVSKPLSTTIIESRPGDLQSLYNGIALLNHGESKFSLVDTENNRHPSTITIDNVQDLSDFIVDAAQRIHLICDGDYKMLPEWAQSYCWTETLKSSPDEMFLTAFDLLAIQPFKTPFEGSLIRRLLKVTGGNPMIMSSWKGLRTWYDRNMKCTEGLSDNFIVALLYLSMACNFDRAEILSSTFQIPASLLIEGRAYFYYDSKLTHKALEILKSFSINFRLLSLSRNQAAIIELGEDVLTNRQTWSPSFIQNASQATSLPQRPSSPVKVDQERSSISSPLPNIKPVSYASKQASNLSKHVNVMSNSNHESTTAESDQSHPTSPFAANGSAAIQLPPMRELPCEDAGRLMEDQTSSIPSDSEPVSPTKKRRRRDSTGGPIWKSPRKKKPVASYR